MNRHHPSMAQSIRIALTACLVAGFFVLTGCVKQRFLIVDQREVSKTQTQEADTTAAPEA